MATEPHSSSMPDDPAHAEGSVFTDVADIERRISRRVDKFFSWLMPIQCGVTIAAAWFIAPKAWSLTPEQQSARLWTVIILGGLAVIVTTTLAGRRRGQLSNRYAISACQMLMCGLFVDQFGGHLEAFFLVYISLAILAFYRSAMVMMIAVVVSLADFLFFAMNWPLPLLVPWRLLECSVAVALEAALLTFGIRQLLLEWRATSDKLFQLDVDKHREIETEVT